MIEKIVETLYREYSIMKAFDERDDGTSTAYNLYASINARIRFAVDIEIIEADDQQIIWNMLREKYNKEQEKLAF